MELPLCHSCAVVDDRTQPCSASVLPSGRESNGWQATLDIQAVPWTLLVMQFPARRSEVVLGILGLSHLGSLYVGEKGQRAGPISGGVRGELPAQSTPVNLGPAVIPVPMAKTEPPDKPANLVCKEQRTMDPISSQVEDDDT